MKPVWFDGWAREARVAEPEKFAAFAETLYQLLAAANERVNLTRIVDENDFWLKHVADSLLIGVLFPEWTQKPLKIADVGCGAGFPSLILAAAYPRWRIWAIDSVGKKTAFVESAAAGLELANVTVVTGRTPELGRQNGWKNRFDLLTARAVGPAEKIYREAEAMLAPHGSCCFYKTPMQCESELPVMNALKCRKKLHWSASARRELPEAAGERGFLLGTPVAPKKA